MSEDKNDTRRPVTRDDNRGRERDPYRGPQVNPHDPRYREMRPVNMTEDGELLVINPEDPGGPAVPESQLPPHDLLVDPNAERQADLDHQARVRDEEAYRAHRREVPGEFA